MAKTKKKHSGKPRGMNYADMLARKRMIREAVTQLIEQNGWVNPKERLPERGVPVLTYNKWGRARVETLRTWDEQPYFVGGLKAGTDVLFWRPLPQLPEVQ